MDVSSFPMKNCGACGESTCETFLERINQKRKDAKECPFYKNNMFSMDYVHGV